MNLWNANCDAKVPKLKRELLRELDIWERTQGGMATASTGSTNPVMRKDFDAAAWSTSHDDDFKKLIQNAKSRKGGAPAVPQSAAGQESNPTVSEGSAAGTAPIETKEEEKRSISLPYEILSQEKGPSKQESSQDPVLDPPVA
jgi:E3 ubiquitin-protein ligase RAD18